MKNLFKISLIFCICLFLPSCFARENDLVPRADDPHYPTQADMLNYSAKRLDKMINRYNKICDKLVKNFHKDKDFIQALRKNQALYFQYRKSERDVVLPKGSSEYGSNYGINSDSVILNSTENQIKNLRKLVDDYCFYNAYYNDENACKPETLNKIFK